MVAFDNIPVSASDKSDSDKGDRYDNSVLIGSSMKRWFGGRYWAKELLDLYTRVCPLLLTGATTPLSGP
jgi:hypothetical protein